MVTECDTLWPEGHDDRHIGELLMAIAQREQAFKDMPADLPEGTFGWLPYSIANFILYLSDAVMYAPGPKFLDVGCGPGTKLIVAEALFGLQVAGIEIVPEWAHQARLSGLRVQCWDARTWEGYREADIVYHNRPVDPQEPFERHVMEHMRSGAVLIAVNARLRASDEGWPQIAEEYADPRAPVAGVWRKP